MFTGLIEAVGRVTGRTALREGVRLRVETSLAAEVAPGDSLATNGVCLTVVETDGAELLADVSPETLRVTTLGGIQVGSPVNLERPLRADSRLGGHFVQGHVDATGELVAIVSEGEFYRIRVSFPPDLASFFIHKGSVAIDGISLTIASLGVDAFEIQIVPHTWGHTTLGEARPGDRVNLECDLVGKYVVRAAELAAAGHPAKGK